MALMAEIHDDENGLLRRSDMTLRDWFAGQALAATSEALMKSGFDARMEPSEVYKAMARINYAIADAMMEARKK